MAVLSHLRPQTFLLGAIALVSIIGVGCGETDQIRSYSAPKETKPIAKEAPPASQPGAPTDRMLTAILPSGGQAWFFKVVGPIREVDKHEKELNDFFSSIRFGDDGKAKWQLPTGWTEGGPKPMRLATLIIPTDTKPLELTVTSLPWSGTPDDTLRNVNRWRGQLQLPPIGTAELSSSLREAKAGDLPMSIVDLRGRFGNTGMTPPFAGPPSVPARPAMPAAPSGGLPPGGLPPGHPPIDSSARAATAAKPSAEAAAPLTSAAPQSTPPADWKSLPADGIRKAAYLIGDENHGAIVTLISFPGSEGPMISDPLQNVNRWRREVGMPEVKAEELKNAVESIEVNGKPAVYVRAIPDAAQSDQSQANLATLAAMAKDNDQIWFIKLKGDRSTVVAQEDAFKNFLKSVRFAADAGASDGHK